MKHLMKHYRKLTNRPLNAYVVYKKLTKINKQAYVLIGLFIVLFMVYVLNATGQIGPYELPYEFLGIAGVVLLVFPLFYIHMKTTHKVVIMEDAFAKQTAFRRFKIVMFKSVKKVRINKKNVLHITTGNSKLKIPTNLYDHSVNVLKTVFDYEGLFDKKKKPYALHIDGGEVQLEEKPITLSRTTQQLLEHLETTYEYVRTDRIEEIILYNAQLEKIKIIDDAHCHLTFDHIDVKSTHPDNPEFRAMKTTNAAIVFEHVSHVEIFDLGKPSQNEVELVGTSIERLKKLQKGANIMDASFKTLADTHSVDITLMQGAKKQRIRFVFKHAIIGFNDFSGVAWFENQ